MLARATLAGTMMAGLLVLLTGCGGFFPPLSDNGSGSGGSSSTGDFVYVANVGTQTIAGYVVGASSSGTGTLTAISGSPYSFPAQQPTAMAITPSNSMLFVGALGGIYGYSINSTTGALTPLLSGGALAITTFGSVSLDVSPDGQWLFALSNDGATLDEYQINTSTGALGQAQGATYIGANGTQAVPKMVKVAPNGSYVFLALGTGGDIVYPFTTSTGALNTASAQTLATGSTTSDNALAINSGTTLLYIARSGGNGGVAVYTIGANGALSSIAGSPFASGNGPMGLQIDSTGKYLYAANRTDGNISGYSIGSTGGLTALANSPYTSGSLVTSLARDNSGKYILAASPGGSPDLSMYSFDTTNAGALDSATTAQTGSDPTQATMVVATH